MTRSGIPRGWPKLIAASLQPGVSYWVRPAHLEALIQALSRMKRPYRYRAHVWHKRQWFGSITVLP